MNIQFCNETVSVIIPVYNAQNYIKQAIESVLKQTYTNIEIIIIDDCSTDNSASLIDSYKQIYSNVKYYLLEKNRGAGYARNKAIELATGRFIAFLDSDDIWYEDKIKKQIEFMKKVKCPFCYTAIEMIDNEGNLLKKKRNIREFCDYNYLLKNTIIATSTVVIDRKYFSDFKMSLRRGGQDYSTWLRLLRNGCIAMGLNESLVSYRISRGSLSSNKLKSIKQIWDIQTKDEGINELNVILNILFFLYNAFMKYFI